MPNSLSKPPVVLVSPDIQRRGKEFGDLSISLSAQYHRAVEGAGGLALSMPPTVSEAAISECVRNCDGVMLTGGDDVDSRLYTRSLPSGLGAKVAVTPDGGERDLRELLLINEVFRQGKPLLAVCRGHQILNVALGGTLYADLPSQKPQGINHRRMDRNIWRISG